MNEWKEMTKGWTILQIVYYIGTLLVTFILGSLMLLGIAGGCIFLYERIF
jgi:hypothetical protein